MTVNIPIPEDLERKLRAENPNLDAAAREAFLVSLYRQGKLVQKQLAELLGLDRFSLEAVLSKYNVTEDLPTQQEIREQIQLSRKLRERN